MNSIDDIPSSWETTNVEVVTVNPHTGEVENSLSATGAGPHVDQVRGTIVSKPCDNCDNGTMELDTEEGVLVCPECGETASPNIQDHA